MAKELTSFRLSEDVKKLLNLIAEKHNRNATNMVEHLILEEAKKLKVKVPKV